jgi:hypothetical protein
VGGSDESSSISTEELLSTVADSAKKAEYKELICSATDDDPPLILNWKNIERFFNAAVASGAVLPFPPPHTVDGFKRYLMQKCRTPGSTGPIDNFAFPCTVAEIIQTGANFQALCYDPWFANVVAADPACVPIATLYVPRARSRARSNMLDRAIRFPPGQPALWG